MDLEVTNAGMDSNASKESAASFIMAAQKLLRDSQILEREFHAAEAALEIRGLMLRCSRGVRLIFDKVLSARIMTNSCTKEANCTQSQTQTWQFWCGLLLNIQRELVGNARC